MHHDKTQPIDFTEDHLDMRDIVARAEWLEEQISTLLGRDEPELDEDCVEELRHCGSDDWADEAELLIALFNETRNEAEGINIKHLIEWRGDWYPALLIADYAMEEHAQTIVADNDLIGDGIPYWIQIDWPATADMLKNAQFQTVQVGHERFCYRVKEDPTGAC